MKKTYAEKKLEKIRKESMIQEQYEEIIQKIKEKLSRIEKIDVAVLFGSFARGDYSLRHSDIDVMIFLDEEQKNPKLEEAILKKIIEITKGKLIQVHTIFQYKKVQEEDASLLLTIAKEGRTLFSKKSIIINENILGLKPVFLIKFDTTGVEQVKKNKLQRFLHGYSVKGKKYKGVIDDEKVIAAGKGAIIVHQEFLEKIMIFFDSIGIQAKQDGKFYTAGSY